MMAAVVPVVPELISHLAKLYGISTKQQHLTSAAVPFDGGSIAMASVPSNVTIDIRSSTILLGPPPFLMEGWPQWVQD